jgi:TonB-dependent SusC/RagA subfamily outer membrane receptor
MLLHQGIDCKEYQYSLLKLSSVKNQIVITNHFNLSNLKTRIIMMNKNQSSRYGLAAYTLVIPLIFLCMVFSYAFAQNKPIADTVKVFTSFQQKPEKAPAKALILLDGKIIDKAKMDAMNPEDIYSVNVLKGKDATEIYGRKGKNGVVLITSKKPGTEKKFAFTYSSSKDTLVMKNGGKPKIFIDGKEVSEDAMKELNPNQIMTINVTKNDFTARELGDKDGKSVIRIITRNNSTSGSSEGSNVSYSTSSSSSGDGKATIIIVTSKGTGDEKDGKTFTIKSDSETKNGTTVTNSSVKLSPDDAYILIDGKEGKLSDVKPENIEKMEVLKGEAAKAKYGDKGAKGVIIITLKK